MSAIDHVLVRVAFSENPGFPVREKVDVVVVMQPQTFIGTAYGHQIAVGLFSYVESYPGASARRLVKTTDRIAYQQQAAV